MILKKNCKKIKRIINMLIDRVLGYMLAIMFAFSFFITEDLVIKIILSGVMGVILIGFTAVSMYIESIDIKLAGI